MAGQDAPKPRDLIQRGNKTPNPAGIVTFIGLRSLDTILQYNLLAGFGAHLLTKAGITTVAPSNVFQTGYSIVDKLQLPLPHLVILAMSFGSAAKQIYWVTSLGQESFSPSTAFTVSIFNTVVNTVNTSLFLAARTSSLSGPLLPGSDIPLYVAIGSILYAIGIALETVSEYQRKVFKDNPTNRGKVMRSGLWGWARHINYGGYALWRGAYCLAASGMLGGLVMGGFQAVDFVTRAVPILDKYCSERYGEQWAGFKQDVKWVILPGIY